MQKVQTLRIWLDLSMPQCHPLSLGFQILNFVAELYQYNIIKIIKFFQNNPFSG